MSEMESNSKVAVRTELYMENECDPVKLTECLLQRLPKHSMADDHKSQIVAMLEDLLLLFEKHPESAPLFRTDLLNWRWFLKQSSDYVKFAFDEKFKRTSKIIQAVFDKQPKPAAKPKEKPRSPVYYEILYRPGIRSIRQYTIDQQIYKEDRRNVDLLRECMICLREEIICAPRTQLSRSCKAQLLDIFLLMSEISAYDVSDALRCSDLLRQLLTCVRDGEKRLNDTKIAEFALNVTKKIKEHARCAWQKGRLLKQRILNDIKTIERNRDLQDQPQFDFDLLVKSEYLKKEKLEEDYLERKTMRMSETKTLDSVQMSETLELDYADSEVMDERYPDPPPTSEISGEGFSSEGRSGLQCDKCRFYIEKYGKEMWDSVVERQLVGEGEDVDGAICLRTRAIPRRDSLNVKGRGQFDPVGDHECRCVHEEEDKFKNPYLYVKSILKC